MPKGSTSFIEQFRLDFQNNPVGSRVVLPDGSHAVVRACINFGDGPMYRVQKCTQRGRYIPMASNVTRWYSICDLRLFYWSASVAPEAAA
jgi:hypothetical protein